jgi:Bacterial type II and III secretion system protein
MMKRTLKTLALFSLTCLLIPAALQARREKPDYASGVRFRNANTTPDPEVSNINEYTYQDEQINIDPEDGVVKVLRTDQKIMLNDYVTAVIPCNNVNPREIRGPIRTMVRKEGGEADVLQDKLTKEFFIHVVCPRFQLPFVEQVIKGLDEDWVLERLDGSGELYYPAKFRDIRKIQRISQFYIGPEGMGRFYFDDLNNAMYYTDQPPLIGLQNWGLSQIDIPPNEVSLDISIYEIDMNNDTMLGLDWSAWRRGPGRNLFELGHYKQYSSGGATNTATDSFVGNDFEQDYSFTSISATCATQFIDYVKNKGYVREMVKTSVTVKSGDPALIEAVDAVIHFQTEMLFEDEYVQETLEDKNGNEQTVELPEDRGRIVHYREGGDKVGLHLALTPYVALESMEMDVELDVSTVNGYSPQGSPIIGVRHISDYVRLLDGEPFVMGGIDRETTTRNKNGAPILHKLPGLGWAFGAENNAKRNTQIVVVVKPSFMIGADSDKAMPEEAKTLMLQASGESSIEIPKGKWGFDQWLFGKK